MLKELKYLFFLIIIFIFVFLVVDFYFSNDNKKNSYRSLKLINKKNIIYFQELVILKDDTKDSIEFFEKKNNEKIKSYNFWKLINSND
jgi:hypothetical protein